MYNQLRIAGLAADKQACGHYRVIYPLSLARSRGIQTHVFYEVTAEQLRSFDIIIAQRQTNPAILKILERMRSEGKTIIAETDDMLEAVHPSNPAYSAYHAGTTDFDVYSKILDLADGVTVTTPELRAHYKARNRNTYVIPNFIDFGIRDWPDMSFREDRLNIGWSGSTSHIADLPIMGPVLEAVLDKYSTAKYVHFGHPALLEYLTTNYCLPADRVEHIGFASFDDYPKSLTQFDIGLAPVINTSFNMAKSPLKVMELSAVGVPFVASRVAPYQRYTNQGVDGFTADSVDEWIAYLSQMIEDVDTRARMSKAACEKARGFGLKENIGLWTEAWSSIRFASLSGDTGPGDSVSTSKVGRNDPCPCGSGVKYKKCPNGCYPAYGR